MYLKYKLDDILIKDNQRISDKTINESFHKLIQNDHSIYSDSNVEPRIWECRWFNNPDEPGYAQGDAFWLNTETIDDMVKFKNNHIYNYSINNSYLKDIIKKYEENNAEIHELYRNILSGYHDNIYNIKLSALYEIGDITQKTQIRISKIDNNKHSIYDDNYWQDFFVRDGSIDNFESVFENILSTHINKYHLSGENVNLDQYAMIEMDNLTKVQKLLNHNCEIHNSTRYGFDFLITNDIEYSNDTFGVSILSVYDQQNVSSWYELSGDVVYTLNNCIPKADIESKLGRVSNYNTQLAQMVNQMKDNEGFGNITFQMKQLSSSASVNGTSFPNYFKFTEENYERVESTLTNFYVSDYCIGTVETTKPDEQILYHYTVKTPPTINSLDEVEEKYQKRYTPYITSNTITETTTGYREFNIMDSWTRRYNSGVVIQGGTVNIPSIAKNSILRIQLKIPYKYTITTKSMYGEVETIAEDIEYSSSNQLNINNRYTISISPISNSYNDDDNIEIVGIRNDSFDVMVRKNTPSIFQYTVKGIIGHD